MEARQLALRGLEIAINQGLDNNSIDFFVDDKNINFSDYIGAINANGEYTINSEVKAGLLIWGNDNFISVPDTIFNVHDGQKVAYYKL